MSQESSGSPIVSVWADAEAAAAAAAASISHLARSAAASRGAFSLAVSGGLTPWLMLSELAKLAVPWAQTTVVQVDERVADAGDPARNIEGIRRTLPASLGAHLVPMPVEEADLEAACAQYAASLPGMLDVVHLGLGADGHTASLVPGDPVLSVLDRDVAITRPYRGHRRMTLTYPRIARARTIVWLVTGEPKAEALARLIAGDGSIPASRITNSEQLVFCDTAAMPD